MIGFYAVVAKLNLVKKLIGLALCSRRPYSCSTSLWAKWMAERHQSTPARPPKPEVFSNPLPQVLILTAIVVGISTTALGLGLIVRIKEEYGSIEEDQIQEIDRR